MLAYLSDAPGCVMHGIGPVFDSSRYLLSEIGIATLITHLTAESSKTSQLPLPILLRSLRKLKEIVSNLSSQMHQVSSVSLINIKFTDTEACSDTSAEPAEEMPSVYVTGAKLAVNCKH